MGKDNLIVTKSIYKITNNINGKVYIGQSKDPERRLKEHIAGKNDNNSVIHLAIKKYGINSFSFDILEKNIKNYNEREKYWIKYYHSQDREMGYNRTEGGEEPPIIRGENSALSKYSNEIIHNIENDIMNTKLIFSDIANKYNTSESYISLINRGIVRRNKNLSYPLRFSNNIVNEDIYNLIIHDLIFTHLPTEHIAKKYKVSSTTVYRLNKGLIHHINIIEYPIRKDYSKYSNWFIDNIYNEIKRNKYRFSDIEKMYGISKNTLNRINQGKICKRENEIYPLRSSSQRVIKPVSTISSEMESSPAISTQADCK